MPLIASTSCRLTLLLVLAASPAAQAQATPEEPLDRRLAAEGPAALAKAAREQGDPYRGAVLFYQPHLSCTKCHTCGDAGAGSPLGPDLARPEPTWDPARVVESVLHPSKAVRRGYESVTVVRADGTAVTGLLSEDRDDALVLRDPAANGAAVTVPKAEIGDRSAASGSLMPAGLASLLADRQQFLDLAAFLIEAAEFGPARARALRPAPGVLDPPLPAYEADLDHAGLIRESDAAAFDRGGRIYALSCATCHGTHDAPGSMPTSPRFAEGRFRNGSDPAAMYRTLTHGYGMMAPQATLVPRQKYDVIHYIREAYLRPGDPGRYVPADEAYLASLPKGTSRGPTPPPGEPWRRADYGPTLTGTFEVGTGGGNIAYKGVAVRLDPGAGGVARGRAWSIFEHDTMRAAGGWTGSGFIDWNGINFDGRHEVHPRVTGDVAFETAAGPGWADPETGSFADPRPTGRDGKPYGPLPRTWGRYRGLYHAGDRVVLSYDVGRTAVLESPGLAAAGAVPVFTRAFDVGPRARPMALRVLRHRGGDGAEVRVRRQGESSFAVLDPAPVTPTPAPAAGVVGAPAGAEWSAEAGHLVLRLPAGTGTLRFVVWAATLPAGEKAEAAAAAVSKDVAPADLSALTNGGKSRWGSSITTTVERGPDDGPFAADALSVPADNPWAAQLRLTGLDFLAGGTELAACTWDGDVWRVSGLDRTDGALTWRRIASGLFQPLGLKVVAGAVHVGCRDQIAVLRDLNGDGETDFYECLNSDHQVTESFHEFATGLQTDADGNFVYAKGARHGKPAVVPHHGTLLRVAADGSRTDVLATGFRAPNGVCANPDGTFFVTDQEGHWTPKNRLNLVRPDGRFFGNLWGHTGVADRSDAAAEEPVCWITNRFDRSPAEPVRVESRAWGGLDGTLLSLSYGTGKVHIVSYERTGEGAQGGMVALPLPPFPTGVMRGRFGPADGHLYLCGMYAWAGDRQTPGGLYRVRATGRPAHLPAEFRVTPDGLALTFSDPLHPDAASDPRSFGLKAWDLERSERYGSAHLDERPLRVAGARLAEDGRTVTLTVPDLRPTRGLELWYSVRGADGGEVDGLMHGSVHRLPASIGEASADALPRGRPEPATPPTAEANP